jgi:hypothetical protein
MVGGGPSDGQINGMAWQFGSAGRSFCVSDEERYVCP